MTQRTLEREPKHSRTRLERYSIIMTFIDGMVARDAIDTNGQSRRLPLLEELGRQVGFLHSAGNCSRRLDYFKHYPTGWRQAVHHRFRNGHEILRAEDRGTDLHLLQRSLIATHALEAKVRSNGSGKAIERLLAKRLRDQVFAKPRKLHGEDDTSPSDKRTLWFVNSELSQVPGSPQNS